jgi:AcrR family transcriptional regulator
MDVRSQILQEATRLFASRGFGATSLKAIADAVGVSKPSVLYHFASKEILHEAVMDQLLSRWNEALPRVLRAAAGEDRFDAVLDETVGFFLDDPDRARLLLRETIDRPEAMRGRLPAYVSPWLSFISEAIRRSQASGDFRAEVDPEAYVMQVINLVIGGVAMMDALGPVLPDRVEGAEQSDEERRERLVRELKRFARAGLFAQPSIVRSNHRSTAQISDVISE